MFEPVRIISFGIVLAGVSAAWLVLLHFCDAWRDAQGRRPPGVPVGWVWPVGEPLARLEVQVAVEDRFASDGVSRVDVDLRPGVM